MVTVVCADKVTFKSVSCGTECLNKKCGPFVCVCVCVRHGLSGASSETATAGHRTVHINLRYVSELPGSRLEQPTVSGAFFVCVHSGNMQMLFAQMFVFMNLF